MHRQKERQEKKEKKKKEDIFPVIFPVRFDHPSRLLCPETYKDFGKCLFKTSSEEMIKVPKMYKQLTDIY